MFKHHLAQKLFLPQNMEVLLYGQNTIGNRLCPVHSFLFFFSHMNASQIMPAAPLRERRFVTAQTQCVTNPGPEPHVEEDVSLLSISHRILDRFVYYQACEMTTCLSHGVSLHFFYLCCSCVTADIYNYCSGVAFVLHVLNERTNTHDERVDTPRYFSIFVLLTHGNIVGS